MSRRQQLLTMHSMLEHVAQEAARNGYGLIATLSAAAGDAAREELAKVERLDRKPAASSHPARRKDRVPETSFA